MRWLFYERDLIRLSTPASAHRRTQFGGEKMSMSKFKTGKWDCYFLKSSLMPPMSKEKIEDKKLQ